MSCFLYLIAFCFFQLISVILVCCLRISKIIWRFMSAKGHSLTFVQDHWVSTISNNFSETWLIEAKFHVEPPWNGGTKFWSNGPGHVTKMAAMPIQVTWPRWPPCPYMVKTFKTLLLWNREANDLETWYTAWGYSYTQMMSEKIETSDQSWGCWDKISGL